MATEGISLDYEALDSWTLEESIGAIIDSNRRAVDAVARVAPELAKAAEGIRDRLAKGGRLIYLGAGTSGRLAMQDAAELPPTFGFERTVNLLAGGSDASRQAKEDAEDDEEEAITGIREAGVTEQDAVIGIAASGNTPYTIAGIREARNRGAFTVALANNADAPLLKVADVGVVLATGPEVLAGSTRLAAGTAQKIALNALSTSVLASLGGAYKNLMVGMRPKNKKLRERAVSIVSHGAEVEPEEARAALEASHWQMREAIVMLKASVDLAEAQDRLARHQNRVREALKEKL
ncbi:MAG: N-acetylmuramic acid 6-phosphate etherase [Trueperaceae bacterium]|nr:N-acetylmuramic acid 6-phosphate etherase [Trueperaceae bacterium]